MIIYCFVFLIPTQGKSSKKDNDTREILKNTTEEVIDMNETLIKNQELDMAKTENTTLGCEVLNNIKDMEACEILSTYYEDDGIPVDVVKIAKRIGISLGSIDFTRLEKSAAFKDITGNGNHILGAVYVNGNDLQIVYHNTLHESPSTKGLSDIDKKEKLLRRQRFTIAHEIAHCCQSMEPGVKSHIEFRTDQITYDEGKERNANIFAGELLIPFEQLDAICSTLNRIVSLSFLSDIFKVSKNVMRARIDYLKSQGHLLDLKYI